MPTATTAGRDRVRAALVATEVALAVVLLATAGLTVRSFLQVLAVHPGFRPDSVLVFDLLAPQSRYSDEASQIQLFRDVTTRLEALPGVQAAGAISFLPLGGGQNMGSFTIDGDPPPAPGRQTFAERRLITTGYFAAMGIPLRRGRSFSVDDTLDHPRVVVINDTFARRFFAGRDPLGQRLRTGGALRTIVGIVPDVRSSSLEGDVNAQLYIPHTQWAWSGMSVVAHVQGDPLAAAATVRNAVKGVDPLLAAANVRTMEQVVSKASSARRFTMALLAFFALAALLLTGLGIYGVIAFLVGRRRHEIGVRVALGARRADIVRLVIGQGMKPVVIGAAAGLLGSLAGARLVASQLYGVSASDPLTLISILALLAAAALLACWLPARRATRVSPLEALRYQ